MVLVPPSEFYRAWLGSAATTIGKSVGGAPGFVYETVFHKALAKAAGLSEPRATGN